MEGPGNGKYKVHITKQTCGCRAWDLSGIPCIHAIAAFNFLNKDVYDYVHECYKVNTYLQTCNNLMNPINGRELWPESENPTLLPPDVEKRVGRPKKARRRELEEPANPKKLGRKGIKMTCKKCGIVGHNKRTCKKQKTTTTASGGGESSGVGATVGVGPNEANPTHSIVSAIVSTNT